ncbi:MAG: group II intron reverse transcriptase/maturase [Peptococcaceae bacterium]|nr:group II intron reverse transcriptase/maturase [Peptococcaceae bacterium]
MEKALARENLVKALERVEANGGAPGIDGMETQDLRPFLHENWETIREQLLGETYEPQPVRRVEISKRSGRGTRKLGIPTVLDRFIQQALLQVLTPIFDPGFSESSYGFRPGRRGHDAVRKMRRHVQEGYTWVVDIDLERYFDTVNHDMLMARVARKVEDKRVLRLIRRYLKAGVMMDGIVVTTEEGTPQGGPLSPLLSNVYLDEMDKELEKRGHRFCRYADDVNIYVRSRRAAERVMASITTFLETKLKLKVNREKSAVDRPWRRAFLGFSLYFRQDGPRIRLAPETIRRIKETLRKLTDRNWSISLAERLRKVTLYLNGWLGYYALADAKRVLQRLEEWLRHRLRACVWVTWKRVRTRYRMLRSLGLPEWRVHKLANARKGPWRMAAGPLNSVLTAAWWRSQGLISLVDRYLEIRQQWRTAGCGPARPVV